MKNLIQNLNIVIPSNVSLSSVEDLSKDVIARAGARSNLKIAALTLAMSLFFVAVSTASAAGVKIDPSYHPSNAPTITGEAADSEKEKKLDTETARVAFFARIVNVLLGIVGIIAVFALINNAWWMAASAGQEEALTQRKKGLKWAVIGLILVILSYSIVRWIVSIPFQADEEAPAATFEKMSVPEGQLEPGSTPSVDELKSMDKDQYFQESDSSPGLNLEKTGIEGAPPDIKSEESLQSESEQYQKTEKLKSEIESEMEQDKAFKKMDVPEGQFSLPPY